MSVKKYGTFETRFTAKTEKPFEVDFSAVFCCPDKTEVRVHGFYDGNDEFVLRFMPEQEGQYSFTTHSNIKELNGKQGTFLCEGVSGHGKVIADGIYLKHSDGKRHNSVGTTCYAWLYQSEQVRNDTLSELAKGYFNKIRMCVLPKWYMMNQTQPEVFPFEGTLSNFDYNKPNVEFFRRLDVYVERLQELDIQADIILLHPYDNKEWGFSAMSEKQDKAYIRYVTARLSAYSNVWWSVANEYDIFFNNKSNYKHKYSAWKRLIKTVSNCDPYKHMLGIHQCNKVFNHSYKYLTHCSMQRTCMYVTTENTVALQKKYKKPVVWDEIAYEGNIKSTFGNCTAEELVRRFWEATIRGGYAGHGETYYDENDILWWAKGGRLHGENYKRIKFLKDVMESYGNPQLYCYQSEQQLPVGIYDDDIFAFYYGNTMSVKQDVFLPQKYQYRVEIIDTWNMTREVLDGAYSGISEIPLPQRPFIAVIAQKLAGQKGLPERFDADCLLRDTKNFKGGKLIYKILTKTSVLKGNEFVLYSSLNYLQTMAGDGVTDKMVTELTEYVNDGKLLKHLFAMLKKERK